MAFDGGMQLAFDAAGGRSELARRMGLPRQNLKWARCPKDKLFAVAQAAGVEPEKVRPDLVDWIRLERQRLLLERARSRFGLSGPAQIKTPGSPMPAIVEVFELGLTVAALRFAAQARGQQLHQVLKGADQPAQSARAYGMALAHVVGRVSSTSVAMVVGCSRQNVENAAHRYERARDGDDDAEGGRVVERGRVRRAKKPNDDLWAAERRFLEELST